MQTVLRLLAVLFVAGLLNSANAGVKFDKKPNVIVILADDMGSGDVQALNPKSPVPTPNLDLLSQEGVTFTNGHSNSAVCTPTRYGVMTGRYCWRSSKKSGVLNGYSKHLIEPDRYTIADMFKAKGYATACIGKWHLGMDLPLKGRNKVDLAGKVKNGPVANGFDHFYGITASLDFPPYVYIDDDRIDAEAIENKPARKFPDYLRAGETGTNFDHETSLDVFTARTVSYIKKQAEAKQPFFVYMPLTAPHKPVLPAKRFRGKSSIGWYGDFIIQVDWTVGQVIQAVKDSGIDDNTMILYTSDNGSFMKKLPQDGDAKDHTTDNGIQGYFSKHHHANFPYRGEKTDIHEGGHRVPFLVRYPGAFKAGLKSNETVSTVDILATCAELIGQTIPKDAAEDSYSFYSLLKGERTHKRAPMISHSINGCFAIHSGHWKLIATSKAGGRGGKSKPFQKPYQLYDLSKDIAEANNLIAAHPEVAERLEKELQVIIKQQGQARN